MRPLKVVITTPWGTRAGGAEQLLWTLLRHLDRGSVEPVVVFFEPGPFQSEVAELGIRTYVIPAGRLRQPIRVARTVRAIASVLREERPELLLNWTGKTHLYGWPAAALAGMAARTAWWQHVIPTRNWFDSLVTLLPARAVVCYSTATATAQDRLWPKRRTVVIPAGIDEQMYATEEALDSIRLAHHIPRDRFVLVAVGRLQPGKRHDVFLNLVDRLRRRGHDVHGLVVGGTVFKLSTDHEAELGSLVEKLGLSEAVTFTGQVDDSAPYIQLADVLVSASESESFGIALIEALALRTPVVAFDSGGPAEIIEDGVSGLLLETLSPDDLADAVERLIIEPDLGDRLARAARRRFEAQFRGERAAARFQEMLRDVSGRRVA
jgi:glycosyltransferase involved in cell wall biosynthesis